jgi:primosomal protein N''
MSTTSKWLADNLAAVIVAIAQANATLAGKQDQPTDRPAGGQE